MEKWSRVLILFIGYLNWCVVQIYDQVYEEDVTLTNTGKVTLEYSSINATDTTDLLPGQVSIMPSVVSV